MTQSAVFREHSGWTRLPARVRREPIILFLLAGVISTLVDAGLLVLLTSGLHIWYLASAVCSYCCGILASYLLNRRFTFRDHNPRYLTQFATFAAISACCLLVHTTLLWLLVELFVLHYLAAKFVATAGVFCMNYAAQSRITFRAGGPGSLPQGAGK